MLDLPEEDQKPSPMSPSSRATGIAGQQGRGAWHPYEAALAVSTEDVELTLRPFGLAPWVDFLLNPRRLRGSDFLMRWSQGRWSEDRLIHAVETTLRYFALPYGPSGTAPDDPREFELYFERLDHAGLGAVKRPDLLIFPTHIRVSVERLVQEAGGLTELPFIREDDVRIRAILDAAVVGIECENSLWKSKQMPDYGAQLTLQRRLGGKLGLKKTAVLPTVIIKEEDREPLRRWQREMRVPIHIWHVFFDQAFGISLDRAEELINEGFIEATEQVFQAPGGATTRKVIYKCPYLYAYALGESVEEPQLVGSYIEDKNGHILPYVRFEGGKLVLAPSAVVELDRLGRQKIG